MKISELEKCGLRKLRRLSKTQRISGVLCIVYFLEKNLNGNNNNVVFYKTNYNPTETSSSPELKSILFLFLTAKTMNIIIMINMTAMQATTMPIISPYDKPFFFLGTFSILLVATRHFLFCSSSVHFAYGYFA